MNNYIQTGIENAQFFCDIGLTHRLILSSGAARIESDGMEPLVFSSGEIPHKYLWFLGAVKKDVRKSRAFNENKEYIKRLCSKDVSYNMDGGKRIGTYTVVTEIDVNGAYWTVARKLGYISEKIYQKGIEINEKGENKIPKMIRLIALGALARKRTVREFTKEKGYTSLPLDYDPELGGVFFHISKHLGELMLQCIDEIGEDPFFFFWVDALMIHTSAKWAVTNFFQNAGYEVKEKPYAKIEITEVKGQKVGICYEKSGRKKPFNLSLNFECQIAFNDFVNEIKNNYNGY